VDYVGSDDTDAYLPVAIGLVGIYRSSLLASRLMASRTNPLNLVPVDLPSCFYLGEQFVLVASDLFY
jgi:hypothetical protein